jgi:radical SAM protein with 4Fe4S-binding SPASM domain
MKEALKKWLRSHGITRSHANALQYWVPYNFMNGKAWTPQSITIETTLRCNLSCQMCPLDLPRMIHDHTHPEYVQERRKAEMTTAEVLGVIDDVANMGVREMTLTGGELFLRRDAMELIEHAKRRGRRLCVNTNGWFLTRAHARRLVEIGVDAMSVSVDGPDEVHDFIRRGNGSFRRICEGLAVLKEEKAALGKTNPKIGISVTLSALNQDRFSEVLDALHEYGVASVDFDFMFFTDEESIRRTQEMIPLPVHPKEENQILPDSLRDVDADVMFAEMQKAREKAQKYGIFIDFGPPFKTKEQVHKRFHDEKYTFVDKCFYPWKAARINPYGDVYSCSIDVAFGNIREAPFSTLWNGEAYQVFRRTLKDHRLFPKCSKCCALNNELWNHLPAFGKAVVDDSFTSSSNNGKPVNASAAEETYAPSAK